MTTSELSLDALEQRVASLTEVAVPADVFRVLLEASSIGAPRAYLVLRRPGVWKGWGAVGYGADLARRIRETQQERPTWLGRLDGEGTPFRVSPPVAEAAVEFGQPVPDETTAFGLRVGGRVIAAIVAERIRSEEPWHPAALGVLVHAARLRLELDLVQRRKGAPTGPGLPREAPAPAVPVLPSIEPAPIAAASIVPEESAALAPVEVPSVAAASPDAAADPRKIEEARRYARLVATDIRLYNEESVMLGRRQGDLARRLADPIARGRESFDKRFHELGADGARILRDAYVHVLAGGDASLIPPE